VGGFTLLQRQAFVSFFLIYTSFALIHPDSQLHAPFTIHLPALMAQQSAREIRGVSRTHFGGTGVFTPVRAGSGYNNWY
jgi:hypothetical protein